MWALMSATCSELGMDESFGLRDGSIRRCSRLPSRARVLSAAARGSGLPGGVKGDFNVSVGKIYRRIKTSRGCTRENRVQVNEFVALASLKLVTGKCKFSKRRVRILSSVSLYM